MNGATTVFVYGTLKHGCRNHRVLESAVFLGEAWTRPLYRMVSCGSYPGLVHAESLKQGQAIYGELYRVDPLLLAARDALEDVPHEYIRDAIELQDGVIAQAYFYRGETANLSLCGAVWEEQ
jgi:gamma-glutamylcyclotransferase (GGCT)/AIG2-like uncharacterized protein YtfP